MRSQRGLSNASSRSAISRVQASWKAPWLRKLPRNSFSDLLSTSHSPGM